MRKRQFFKLLLTILTISFLALFLSGCLIIIDNPIVEIDIVNDNWTYEIYVDGNYYGITNSSGNLTLYSISPGYHHFEAQDTSFLGRYGDKWQTIKSGYNKVNINTY